MNWRVTATLCIAAFVLRLSAQAGTVQKVWEVNLTKKVDTGGRESTLPIFALRFSPDGRKLAAIIDRYGIGDDARNLLVLLDIDHPGGRLQQFEVGVGVLENENGRIGLNFGWSPSGQIVYASGTVVHVESGKTCQLPNGSVFIRDDLAISRIYPSQLESTSHFKFYDAECHERQMWDVPSDWSMQDVSLDRSLLAVVSYPASETWVIDPTQRLVIRRFHGTEARSPQFADYGRAICGGSNPLDSDRTPAACWSVDTGAKIGEMPKANGSFALSTATRGRRVALSDYRRKKIPFSYEYTAKFIGRVVWDFGSGREIASWRPDSQSYTLPRASKPTTELSRFAVSPDGDYLAEGGNGLIRLYKIVP
jgi:hypothetical protein